MSTTSITALPTEGEDLTNHNLVETADSTEEGPMEFIEEYGYIKMNVPGFDRPLYIDNAGSILESAAILEKTEEQVWAVVFLPDPTGARLPHAGVSDKFMEASKIDRYHHITYNVELGTGNYTWCGNFLNEYDYSAKEVKQTHLTPDHASNPDILFTDEQRLSVYRQVCEIGVRLAEIRKMSEDNE